VRWLPQRPYSVRMHGQHRPAARLFLGLDHRLGAKPVVSVDDVELGVLVGLGLVRNQMKAFPMLFILVTKSGFRSTGHR